LATDQDNFVDVDQLQPGIHVCLDLSWMDHPFTFSSFRIKNQEQIDIIKTMRLGKVRIDPSKSTTEPLQKTETHSTQAEQPLPMDMHLVEEKRARVDVLKQQREAATRVEKQFVAAAGIVKNIGTNLFSQPEKTIKEASSLIQQMTASMISDMDVAIHVMHEKVGTEEMYYHSLNTTVLCLMLGKEMGLSAQDAHILGLGALFHDIGTAELPSTITKKKEPLTKAERSFYQQHCDYGARIGKQVGLPPSVIEIIQSHHEFVDGSGYPRGINAEKNSLNARIVEVVNTYDELCNNNDVSKSLTPYEALSLMFSQQRGKHAADVLNTFIRCMGVYPPGTLAKLSNDMICIVTAVNSSKPLKPVVLVYDPDTPKTEAILLDLEKEAEVSIVKSIRPGVLSQEVLAYLSPRNKLVYYYDSEHRKPEQKGA